MIWTVVAIRHIPLSFMHAHRRRSLQDDTGVELELEPRGLEARRSRSLGGGAKSYLREDPGTL